MEGMANAAGDYSMLSRALMLMDRFGTEAFVRIAGPSGASDDLFAGLR